VVRGAGRSFSSGRDTKELGIRPDGVSDYDYIAAGHAGTRLLLNLRCPTIAALKGWVLGGSFERALLCDIRVAADDTRMALPELAHGVIPDSGGVARLFQMAGHGLAADLALTGRVMDAAEAMQHGIVSRVVAVDDLDDEVMTMARTIASRPQLATELAKATITALATPAVDATLDRELLAQTAVMASAEFQAARAARTTS
jgi:enoyl-CoA hydratase/carnithine racemase